VGPEDALGDEAAEVSGEEVVVPGGEAGVVAEDVFRDGGAGRGAAQLR